MTDLERMQAALVAADEAGDQEGARAIAARLRNLRSAAVKVESDPITQGARRFAEDMPFGEQVMAGRGQGMMQLGRGAAQLTGLEKIPAVRSALGMEDYKKIDAPLMATPGGQYGAAESTITTLAPAAVIPGAQTFGGAAAISAGIGALQPSRDAAERLWKMFQGGALGGTAQGASQIPRLVEGAKNVGRSLTQPLYEEGQEQILGKLLRRFSGGQEDDVIRNLQAAKILVPGSEPTAGQAAGNAGIAALERTSVATQPTVMELHRQQLARQNAARVDALRNMAGEGGRREAMTAIRDTGADEMYGAARALGVDKGMVRSMKPQIDNLLQRMPSGVLERARELARMNGEKLDKAGSVQGLHWIKKGVDDILSGAKQTGIGKETTRAAMQFQDDLLNVLDELSPAYGQARRSFAEMSRIPNQMGTAGEIAERAIRPLDEQMMPAAYARALSDTAAQRGTGFKGATLAGTMEPKQLATLNAIKEDLARSQFAQNAGRGPGSDTVQKMAMTNLLESVGAQRVPTLLNRPAMLANWLLEKTYAGADKQMSKKLAEALLDPQQTARLMQGVKQPQVPMDEQTRQRLALLARSLAMPAIPAMTEGR